MNKYEIYEMTDAYLSDYIYQLDEIEEGIRREINEAIDESKGINDTVRYNCVRLFKMILDDSKNAKRIEVKGFGGVIKRRGRVKFEMEVSPNEHVDIKIPDSPINVYYTFYNFKDKESKERFDFGDKNHKYDCECVCNGSGYLNIIYLNFYTISGHTDVSKWADSIQHELSHNFEITNRCKPYNNSDYYNTGRRMLSSSNIIEQYIGRVIYMSDKSEITAYSNGLYAYMAEKHIILPKYITLRHSDFFKMLKELNNAVSFLKLNKTNSDVIKKLDELNLSYDKLIKIGEDTIKKWNSASVRTILKYRTDVKEKLDYWTDGKEDNYI